ncbi:MAG TPA: hypothetical protein VF155_10385 [Candidatus Dormibacteraeota bacterium]
MRRATRWIAGAAIASATGVSLASCATPPTAGLPPSPPTVDVAMRDYWFDFNGSSIPRGRVVFQISNAGRQYHQLALIPLPADFPPIQAQLRGADRRVVQELVSSPPLQPGKRDTFAAYLTPGRWAFVDFFIGPEGSHAAMGMGAEFRVR